MGLDQYLYAKQYTSQFSKNPELNIQLVELSGASSWAMPEFGSYIQIPVMYWRKENAIHQWFVDNCQGGVDDCRSSYVSREQLKELLAVCVRVIENPALAGEIMPTQGGFFFGSTDYDEWYFAGLNETVKKIADLLACVSDEWEFYYQSSW
jgi:hypothetical protein